jgi:ankyrin repeat protein
MYTKPSHSGAKIANLNGIHAAQVVKLLLASGADVLAADEDGTTALKSAVQGNFGEVAVLLVEGGANPNDVYKVRLLHFGD